MKRAYSLVALMLLASLLCTALVSCSPTVSGSYYSGDKDGKGTYVSFEFSQRNVKITSFFENKLVWETQAAYCIDKAETTITIELPEFAEEAAKCYSGEFSFKQGEDYVKIGVIKYTKAE